MARPCPAKEELKPDCHRRLVQLARIPMKYRININWSPDAFYEPDWREMTKEQYLSEWHLSEDEWRDMVDAGAIHPLNDPNSPAKGVESPSPDSPMRELLQAMKAMGELTAVAKLMDAKAWKLIESLTNDPREYPKAVKIGTVGTDVATIRIDGVTSEPLEIRTGSDGGFDVYADSYDDDGIPGRIIIDLGRGVLPENS